MKPLTFALLIASQTFQVTLTLCGDEFVIGDTCPVTKPIVDHAEAKLLFTDIDSGPSTGLNDGIGSGAIVTIWGKGLGSSQNTSKVYFTDTNGVKRLCELYYWKNAAGQLPSGPANLYDSHGYQEIACSIPESASGIGELSVTMNESKTNALPFTVRAGRILFVSPGGYNNNDCSWSTPCATIDGGYKYSRQNKGLGNQRMKAGDIVYSLGVIESDKTDSKIQVGMFLRSLKGTKNNPISIVAYPNTRPVVSAGNWGVKPYKSSHINISKYAIEVGHVPTSNPVDAGAPAESNNHIAAAQGRYVGNLMTQIQGTCFTGWSGAITTHGNGGDNMKSYGNHIKELGCANSSRYQHTIYLSNRVVGEYIQGWDFSHNRLESNDVFFGIHMYDQTLYGDPVHTDCHWDVAGTIKVTHNVVENQRGAGINIATKDNAGDKNTCWTADIVITDNKLINVGIGKPQEDNVTNADAIRVTGQLGASQVNISNNIIYGYGNSDSWDNDDGHAIVVDLSIANPNVIIENNSITQTQVNDRMFWVFINEEYEATNNTFYNEILKENTAKPEGF